MPVSAEEDLASLMVVDFGNALRNTDEELSLYYSDFELQTLLYRAPEVIFGMKFSLEVSFRMHCVFVFVSEQMMFNVNSFSE